MHRDLGRSLALAGAVLLLAGLAITFVPGLPLLGRLPGDVRLEGEGWAVYAPIGTSIVLSIVLTLVLSLVARRR